MCTKEAAKKQWAAPVLLWMGACGDVEGAELLLPRRAGPPLAPLAPMVPARVPCHSPVLLASPLAPWDRGPKVSHQNWDTWQSSFLCRLCEMHTIPQSLQAQLQTKQRWQE